jgi:hypothetical protein
MKVIKGRIEKKIASFYKKPLSLLVGQINTIIIVTRIFQLATIEKGI